jgi:hypothetical protein
LKKTLFVTVLVPFFLKMAFGKCWRVLAKLLGDYRQVLAKLFGKCRRVSHISEKGHFGDCEYSPKMDTFY